MTFTVVLVLVEGSFHRTPLLWSHTENERSFIEGADSSEMQWHVEILVVAVFYVS